LVIQGTSVSVFCPCSGAKPASISRSPKGAGQLENYFLNGLVECGDSWPEAEAAAQGSIVPGPPVEESFGNKAEFENELKKLL
jgi:hypothetical protein